ncbi:hypothetical protein [Hyphomonas sp.]|uniref:hypothetical protein n=1 Tax=Hyphomonas sp. TaxID=87 RepID=UPI00391BFFBF
MQDTLDQIPPEAWPIIDLLFNVTMAAAGIWLAITVFVVWRRHASNLTPVHAAGRNRKAQPDFLKVDRKARAEAIKRGAAHEKDLDRRDEAEAKAAAEAATAAAKAAEAEARRNAPMTFAQRISGLVTFLLSLFTLLSIIVSSIFTISRMGDYVGEYTAWERITSIIMQHPIAFTICVLIIIARIYTQFFPSAKKEG